MYHWICSGRDRKWGCFSADFEGYCTSKSKKGYKTKEQAEKAAKLHVNKCRFNGPIHIYEK